MVRRAVSWRSTVEQISTCIPWKTPFCSRWMPEKGCDPMDSLCWSRLLAGLDQWREEHMLEQVCWQDLWPRGGPTLEQSVPEVWHFVEGTHTGAFNELQPVGSTHVGTVCGGLSPVRGTPCWSRDRGWERRSGRDNVWWTDSNPHCPTPCAARGQEADKIGRQVEPGKKGEVRGRCFKIWFSFSLSYSILTGNKLISPTWVCFTRDSNCWVISPCPYLHPRAFCSIYSPLPSWGGGVIERFGGHLASNQGQSTSLIL